MQRQVPSVRQVLGAFHEDEEGMEAIQVVMIVAIGALVLLGLAKMWPTISSWVKSTISNLTGTSFD